MVRMIIVRDGGISLLGREGVSMCIALAVKKNMILTEDREENNEGEEDVPKLVSPAFDAWQPRFVGSNTRRMTELKIRRTLG
jgi:hypothetical protein